VAVETGHTGTQQLVVIVIQAIVYYQCSIVLLLSGISLDTDNNVLIIITPAECVVPIFWNKRYTSSLRRKRRQPKRTRAHPARLFRGARRLSIPPTTSGRVTSSFDIQAATIRDDRWRLAFKADCTTTTINDSSQEPDTFSPKLPSQLRRRRPTYHRWHRFDNGWYGAGSLVTRRFRVVTALRGISTGYLANSFHC